ncbi:hypothetical protein ACFQ9X_47000 [Catenulispora yoronensis]
MKRRTGLLFSSAVVLGLAGGAAVGFAVQHARPATPLPPVPHTLAAAVPVPAASPDPATDDGAKLEGDLRDLLLERPADAQDDPVLPARGWLTIGDLADFFEQPDAELTALNRQGFRRAAQAGWKLPDGATVEIDLVQFRNTDGALEFVDATSLQQDATTPVVAGTATGFVGRDVSKNEAGFYSGYGVLRHGNVVVQIFVDQTQDVPRLDDLMALAKGQADRL